MYCFLHAICHLSKLSYFVKYIHVHANGIYQQCSSVMPCYAFINLQIDLWIVNYNTHPMLNLNINQKCIVYKIAM